MPSETVEFFKLLVTFIGGGFVTLVLGPPLKNWWDRRRLRDEQLQTRWAPLRRSARSLEARLCELRRTYAEQPPADPWPGYDYTLDGRRMHYPSKARDFVELYVLDGGRGPISDFYAADLPSPGDHRRDPARVNKMWARLHELTYAASSLHKTAEYLAYAERVRTELEDGRLVVAPADRARLIGRLETVSQVLNGPTGAGVIFEHQQLIGQNAWKDHDNVIDLFAFYTILLGPDWPKFTDLFRFYIDIQFKMDHEVKRTAEALRSLYQAIEALYPALRVDEPARLTDARGG